MEKYKLAIQRLIGQLKHHPRTHDGIFWHKLIYPHQVWLDGVYMAAPFVAQYGQISEDMEYIDDAIDHVLKTASHTYDTGSGLYRHAWDESKNQQWSDPNTGQSPKFWGRSVGWWFMAIVDLLDFVPEKHAKRNELIALILALVNNLEKIQDDEGLWWQILDQPGRKGNYREASVNSMFMYGFAKAVNKGYLPSRYRSTAEKFIKEFENTF